MRAVAHLVTRLGIGFMKLMARWPLPVIRGLGAVLGRLLYLVVASRRHIVLTNLALCFPQLTEAERRALAHQTFVYFAQTWLDRSWLWHAPHELLQQRLHLHGALHEFDGVSPTIIFCPHFYGLDAGAAAINLQVPRYFTSIYTPQANQLVDEWIKAGRLRFGRVRLYNRTDGVKGNVSALRDGEVLYLLPDMDFGPDGSVFVPFFGVPAATVPSIPRLARLGRAKVVTAVPRLTPGGYDIEILPAWDNFPTGNLEADTARGNEVLEELIRTMPAQYYWVHKRFKSRPPGVPPVY